MFHRVVLFKVFPTTAVQLIYASIHTKTSSNMNCHCVKVFNKILFCTSNSALELLFSQSFLQRIENHGVSKYFSATTSTKLQNSQMHQ